MSEEWDSVTRIGSKARAGPGGGPRERVVRTESELNAARRSGANIATEKKYGGSNSRANPEGQHLTKVDRSDDIVKPKTVGSKVGDAIKNRRAQLKNDKGGTMTQSDLAGKISKPVSLIIDYERGTAAPDQQVLSKLESILKIHLRGDKIGEERTFGKKK